MTSTFTCEGAEGETFARDALNTYQMDQEFGEGCATMSYDEASRRTSVECERLAQGLGSTGCGIKARNDALYDTLIAKWEPRNA